VEERRVQHQAILQKLDLIDNNKKSEVVFKQILGLIVFYLQESDNEDMKEADGTPRLRGTPSNPNIVEEYPFKDVMGINLNTHARLT
jgi:hypothetical protein